MPETLDAWLHHLETLHPVGIDMGLERVAEVAARMGLERNAFTVPVVTVAGTNGKGSTVAMLAAVAEVHGLKVGTYTSPHLLRYNERVCFNRVPASDAQLVAGFCQVEQARLAFPAVSLTYFEAGTLCALWCLAQADLDLVVLEVGLGGRLDAVNLIDADVAIVTTIAHDHAAFLGTDIEQIGREKAGIFRAGSPVVLGSRSLPESVRQCADALGAPVYALGEAFQHDAGNNDCWTWVGREAGQSLAALPDPGLPRDNAATALQALALCRVPLEAALCRTAFEQVSLPGRMQWIGQWCLDVGHNPHAAGYVAGRLASQACRGRTWGLLGMLADKDADGVIEALLPVVTDWVCVSLAGERGRDADDLAHRLGRFGIEVAATAVSPAAGARWIGDRLADTDRVLATGSFLTVTELLAMPLPQAVTPREGECYEIRHD
ncbi:bifunctional tetrahydrofolate synthase/dihydrofolate synthase [Halomonas sp. Bachu 37]|uniref:bifunctional tetrahydrofolate synthase/dihydrofolate synthase n=1 Tax=Halomonas kashgarensis TaxID=3084920 RepID=UPI003217D863